MPNIEPLKQRRDELLEQAEARAIYHDIMALESTLGLSVMQEAYPERLTFGDIQREVGWDTGGYFASLPDDYKDGQYAPFYRSEGEHQQIRGIGRFLAGSDEIAACIISNLKNYTIGHGGEVSADSKPKAGGESYAAELQAFIDEFLEANEWTDQGESDTFCQLMIDGDILLWLQGAGKNVPRIRFVGGEHITEPDNPRQVEDYIGVPSLNWRFGVATEHGNAERVYGYMANWFGEGTDWDFIPASESIFLKTNVPRVCKRGVSDFYIPFRRIDRATKLCNNVADQAAIQASIAFIKEAAAGTTQTSLENSNALANRLTSTVGLRRPDGSTGTGTRETFHGGAVINTAGQKYSYGPMGTPAGANFMEGVYQALCRRVGSRWCMPEYMVSGDASNANYSSTLVAESPFIKRVEDAQSKFGKTTAKLIWKAVDMAAKAGRWPGIASAAEFKRLVEIQVSYPNPATRNALEEEQVLDAQQAAGILSAKTRAVESGRDYEQEVKQGAKEKEVPTPGLPGMMPAMESRVGQIAFSLMEDNASA